MQSLISQSLSSVTHISVKSRECAVYALGELFVDCYGYVFRARSAVQTTLILSHLSIEYVLFDIAYIQHRNGINHILVGIEHTLESFFSVLSRRGLHIQRVQAVRKFHFFAVRIGERREFNIEIIEHSEGVLEYSAEESCFGKYGFFRRRKRMFFSLSYTY